MKRQVTMEEISDGKLYTSNDLVKADCGDCEGCHACCTGMGSSIVLDPLDIVRICRGTGAAFETLLAGKIELNVVDGIILPNLKMAGAEDGCGFLTEEGRCGIHFVRESVGFSHLEDIMRKMVSAISFRYMNVRKRTGRK